MKGIQTYLRVFLVSALGSLSAAGSHERIFPPHVTIRSLDGRYCFEQSELVRGTDIIQRYTLYGPDGVSWSFETEQRLRSPVLLSSGKVVAIIHDESEYGYERTLVVAIEPDGAVRVLWEIGVVPHPRVYDAYHPVVGIEADGSSRIAVSVFFHDGPSGSHDADQVFLLTP